MELNILYNPSACCSQHPKFPRDLRIGTFPQLQNFVYNNNCTCYRAMSPALQDALRFFHVSRPVPNLRVISLSYCLIGNQREYEEAMAANEGTWKELDRALAGGHYTGLQKMCMNVELFSNGRGSNASADSCVRDETVRADILNLFCELRKLPISIEVNVVVDRP